MSTSRSNLRVAAAVAKVVLQKLSCTILECFGQSPKKHSELWGVELEQGDQH